MIPKIKVELLKKIDLFQSYDPETLERLVDHSKEIILAPNEILFKDGSMETAMYLILCGEIEVFKGPKQIALLGPGQYLGEMSLIESKARSASARAAQSATLLEIDKELFDTYLATEPKALLSMMRTLSGRIRVDLNNMMDEMRQLSIFTHDIKNNLTPMGLTEEILRELIDVFRGTQAGQKPREGLEDLVECFEALTTTRNNLTTLLEASLNHVKRIKVKHTKTRQDILPVIQETVKGILFHKNLSGKHIRVHSTSDNLQGTFNTLDIQRVLQNLIINAGFVTEEGGAIEVSAEACNGDLQVKVSDKGCGIPEEIRPYLFKEVITTKEDGNGLGLLSCKNIIENDHNGKFWFESEVGKGTTFYFSISL